MARVDEYWRLHEGEGRRADLESRQRFEAVEAALRDAQGMLARDLSGRKSLRGTANATGNANNNSSGLVE